MFLNYQGRVFFDIPVSKIESILKLRCIDNAWVLFGVWPKLDLDLKNTPQAIYLLLCLRALIFNGFDKYQFLIQLLTVQIHFVFLKKIE